MAAASVDIGSTFVGIAKRFSANALRFRTPFLSQLSRTRRPFFIAAVCEYRVPSKAITAANSSGSPLPGLSSSSAFSRRFVAKSSTTEEASDVLTNIPPDDRIPATIITGFLGSGKCLNRPNSVDEIASSARGLFNTMESVPV